MLNEELADRTLAPTERRRREARLRGQVPRSADLTGAVLLLAASVTLWFLLPEAVDALSKLMRNSISVAASSMTGGHSLELMQSACRLAITIVAPILLVTALAGLVANLGQTGWLWIPASVVPRIRSVGLVSFDSATNGAMSLIRLCMLAVVTLRYVMAHDWQLNSVGLDEPAGMLIQPARLLGELLFQIAVSLVLLALADYGFRFWRNEQQLKMTVEERRREQRDESQDPQIKKHRTERGHRGNAAPALSEIGPIAAGER